MTKIRLFTLSACMLWATAAVSSASRADAGVLTSQLGNYAACSAYTQSTYRSWCPDAEGMGQYQTSYIQYIRLNSTACNAGGCSADVGTTYTDMVYTVGRKAVSYRQPTCSGTYWLELGTCSC
jgi:hypothetical protein